MKPDPRSTRLRGVETAIAALRARRGLLSAGGAPARGRLPLPPPASALSRARAAAPAPAPASRQA